MIHGLMSSLHYFLPSSYFKQLGVYTPDLIGYGTRQNGLSTTLEQQAHSVLSLKFCSGKNAFLERP